MTTITESDHPAGAFIVAGIDGSAAAAAAARWAAAQAERHHQALRLVHAYTLPATAGYPGWSPYPEDLGPVLRDEGQALLDRTATNLRDAHPTLQVSTQVLYARPGTALRQESEHARLTVVGSGHATSRTSGALLGSVALAVASTNPVPVAVVHPGDAVDGTGPVVVGVDGSPTSTEAVAFAFEEASVRGTELIAVHAWRDLTVEGHYRIQSLLKDPARIEQEEQEVLSERLAGYRDKYPDVPVRHLVVQGRPSPVLLDVGSTAQLVVVGSHGHGGFTGMLLGSTSQALIVHSNCPVLVVRPAEND